MVHRHKLLVGSLVVVALALALSTARGQGSRVVAARDRIYVDADATGADNGSSWGDAFTDLQAGLDAAAAGDQLWVAEGIYKPSAEHGGRGERYRSFQLKNGVALYGGFDPDLDDIGFKDRDWVVHETILSGDLNGDDGSDFSNNQENSYHVFYHPEGTDLDGSAILDGFVISGGNANLYVSPHWNGGGMYNEGSSPTLINCRFAGNWAAFFGGAIFNISSSPVLNSCTFSSNTSNSGGGGMYNAGSSSPVLSDCTFSANSAGWGGGMVNSGGSSPALTNCTFSANSGVVAGGAMYNYADSAPTLTRCAFAGNSADDTGGGMFNYSSSPVLTDCIFAGNSARDGGGMFNTGSSPALTDCTFSANSATDGGGMFNASSAPTLTNCTFAGNSAGQFGGGMISNGYATLINCTFFGNSAYIGGGMYNVGPSPALTNCTFYGNSAVEHGGGMRNWSSSPALTNCIMWGDTPDEIFNLDPESSPVVAHSDIQGGCNTIPGADCGAGNIDAQPLFVKPGSGDFHLKPNSPCIDAGNNGAPDLPPFDFEGDDRVLDGDRDGEPRVDMGVDEVLPKQGRHRLPSR